MWAYQAESIVVHLGEYPHCRISQTVDCRLVKWMKWILETFHLDIGKYQHWLWMRMWRNEWESGLNLYRGFSNRIWLKTDHLQKSDFFRICFTPAGKEYINPCQAGFRAHVNHWYHGGREKYSLARSQILRKIPGLYLNRLLLRNTRDSHASVNMYS